MVELSAVLPTVLSVDDDETHRCLRTRALRAAGFHVVEAANGEEALELAVEKQPSLVVLDVALPGLNEVCKRLSSDPRTHAIPVLRVSAVGRADEACRQTEEELARANAHLQRVLATITEGYYVLDTRWCFTTLNPAAERYFKRPARDLAGKNIWHETGVSEGPLYDAFHEAAATGREIHFEAESRLNPGVWADLHLYPRDGGLEVYFHDITDRKRAEQALRQSESEQRRQRQFLETLLANAPYCIAVLEGRGLRHTLANSAYQAVAGPDVQVLGRTYREVFPEAAAAGVEAEIHKVLETGEPWAVESYKAPLPGKPNATWEGQVVRLPLAPGEEPSALMLVWDVTGRAALEEALHAREATLNAFFESSPGILNLFDDQLRYIKTDPLTPTYFGLTQETIAGKLLDELAPGFAAGYAPMMRRVVETGEPNTNVEVQGPVPARAGEKADWRASYFPVPLPEGRRGLGVVGVEITDLKEAEEKIRRSEAKYRNLLEMAFEGVWAVDAGARTEFVNKRMAEILKYSGPEEMLGRSAFEFVPDEDHDDLRARLSCAATARYESRLRCKDGSAVWVSVSVTNIQDENGRNAGRLAVIMDVTERKRAQDALIESRKRLELALEAAELGTWEVDIETGIVTASPRTCAMFHFDSALPHVADWIARLHPDDRERVAGEIQRAIAGPSRYETEYRVIAEDGSTRWVFAKAVPVADSQGRTTRLIGVAQDITARKLLEEVRERERELLQGIVQNIPVMLCLYDATLCTFQINREFQQVLGWTTADADEGDFLAKVYPDPSYRAAAVEYMESLTPGWREFNVTAKDGSLVPSEWANIRLSDDRMIGIGIDVRARKQAEEELRRSEARERARAAELQAIMEAVPIATFIARDPDCRQIVGSRMSYDLLRLPPGGNLSKSAPEGERPATFRAMKDGRELPAHELPVQKAAATGLPLRNFEFDVVFEDGACRNLLGDAVPLLGEDGLPRGAVGAFIDITERKRTEERLRQSQKLESVGLLAGGIAHDFNNLLTGIMGNASLVLEEVGPGPARRLKDVVSSAERAAHLTRQLLAYSGKGQFVVRELDVSQAVNEMSGLLESSIPKSATLNLNLERRLPAVRMDPGQLQQILMNLVINAGEAIGEGKPGRITVSTGQSDVRTTFIDSMGEEVAPGRYVLIEVGDTGSGIDEETKRKIFDPFFTTKFTGRGLGLAAVAGIVRSRKGAITVRSVPGAGSTFRVLLPVSESPVQKPEEELHANARTAILVVEDEPRVRDFLGAVFTRQGYRVLLATDGRHALAVCGRESGHIDAAVIDVVMPLMGAGELLAELKACRPDLKILLTSGYSESEAKRICAAWPGAIFIQKPYTAKQIAKTVEDLLRL